MPNPCVAIAQINPRLGDVDANLQIYEQQVKAARERGAEIVIFPELSLTGYFLKDMVPSVALRLDAPVITRLRELSQGCSLIAGFVEEANDFRFYNVAAYFEDGALLHLHRKVYLPTYGLFDEGRYFASGRKIRAFDTKFGRAALLVCEDMWHVSTAYIATLDGALTIFSPSTSPLRGISASGEQDDNARYWELINTAYAQSFALSIVYANRVGFEDGVGFWGGSEIVSPFGERLCKAEYYEEALVLAELDLSDVRRQRIVSPLLRDEDVDLTINELQRIVGRVTCEPEATVATPVRKTR